jgi:hypothetical protein
MDMHICVRYTPYTSFYSHCLIYEFLLAFVKRASPFVSVT